jgi:hypothetical protein
VNIDLEQGIRMLVTPAPVSLLIVVIELRKIAIFAMVLFGVRTIRLIFILVPFVIVIFVLVVIDDLGFLIRGPKRCRYECYWGHQGGAQYGFIPETGHVYSPVQQHSKYRATHSPSAELTTRENAKSAELRSADAAGPARALRIRVWSKAADTECDITQERCGRSKRYKGEIDVSDTIRYFACNVVAGIVRFPRCRRADSHSVNRRGDFFTGAPLQAS